MNSKILRILLVAALLLLAFAVVTSAYAQGATGSNTSSGAAAGTTATPSTLPRTGDATTPTSTATVVLLALGATAGLGGLLMRGLRQPTR